MEIQLCTQAQFFDRLPDFGRGIPDSRTTQFSFGVCEVPSFPNGRVLIIAFSGRADNAACHDAFEVMPAVINAALSLWQPGGVVLDLRQLHYEWGDWMTNSLVAADPQPTTVVVSDRNREGLTTLVSGEMFVQPGDWLYETLDDAVAAIVARFDGREQA
jgi:hypothetical protein